MPLSEVGPGGRMSWAEAVRLTHVILKDPSSHLAAAAAGWQNPASREWQILASLHDYFLKANFEGAEDGFIPRPWDAPRPKPTAMSREALDAILARQRALPPTPQQPSRDLRPNN